MCGLESGFRAGAVETGIDLSGVSDCPARRHRCIIVCGPFGRPFPALRRPNGSATTGMQKHRLTPLLRCDDHRVVP